jgi:hypothetical protein
MTASWLFSRRIPDHGATSLPRERGLPGAQEIRYTSPQRAIAIARRILLRSLLALVVTLAAVYLADTIYIHLLSPAKAYGSIQVNHYLITPLKNGRDEYDFTGSEMKTCVNSLFPHSGDPPCWYLKRHTEQNEKYGKLAPGIPERPQPDSAQSL